MSLFTRNGPGLEPGEPPDTSEETPGDQPAADSSGEEKTVRIARKRFARRQWARRWLRWRRVVVGLLLAAVLLTAGWLVFFSSVLAVQGVQVTGTDVLGTTAVRRAALLPTGAPLATVDLDRITARVERLPAVRSVDVSRAWPDRVRIDVIERRAVAVVDPARAGGRLRGMDRDGVLFRQFPGRPKGLPMIHTAKGTGTNALAEAARVAGSLPPALARKVAFVQVRTVDTIALQLHSGKTVLWGSADGSGQKARVLAVLLPQHAAYYDVSVPGQPIIRK